MRRRRAVGRHQVRTLAAGMAFGVLWMVAQALMPFTIGRAVEDGLVEHDNRALVLWTALLLGLGCAQLLLRRCVRRLDGITGDVLGATAETAATGALVALALIGTP